MLPVGVLALQGAFREHAAMLSRLGARSLLVRSRAELDRVGSLIIPGGESSAIARIARAIGDGHGHSLLDAVATRVRAGMPALGTCAGLILLSERVVDPGALRGFATVGGLPIVVRRNAYGRQSSSFEADVRLATGHGAHRMRAVFIRAPRVEDLRHDVEVLARHDGQPVVVRHGAVMGVSFHPELTADPAIHEEFLASTP